MQPETISFVVSRFDESYTFDLKGLTVQEDTEYSQRFADLADLPAEEKSAKEYQIYVDALADWSVKMPTYKTGGGDAVPIGEGDIKTVVRERFKIRSAANEWIVVTAVSSFRSRHFPTVTFLQPSAE